MPRFQSDFVIDAPLALAFEFHLETDNLLRLLPADSGVRLVSGPPQLSLGSEFEIAVSLMGHHQRLAFRIAELTSPSLIVVAQARGPFRAWHETNRLEAEGAGTKLSYTLDFEPPGGLLGFFATADRILAQVNASFAERKERTAHLLAAWRLKH